MTARQRVMCWDDATMQQDEAWMWVRCWLDVAEWPAVCTDSQVLIRGQAGMRQGLHLAGRMLARCAKCGMGGARID